jgi:hypothetical protein
MVLARSDAELCVALLAQVALAPLGLLAQEVEKPVQQLLRGHVAVENGHALKFQMENIQRPVFSFVPRGEIYPPRGEVVT